MSIHLKKIGMRNIKTALSVFFCIFVYNFLEGRDAFYACVAAVMCMQSTLENTKKVGMERILGTLIGGIMGIIFLFFDKILLLEQYTFLLVSIGIIPLIYICTLFNRGGAVPITCIVFISILFYHRDSSNSYIYAINRIIDTGFGIAVAMLINKYIDKPGLRKKQ